MVGSSSSAKSGFGLTGLIRRIGTVASMFRPDGVIDGVGDVGVGSASDSGRDDGVSTVGVSGSGAGAWVATASLVNMSS